MRRGRRVEVCGVIPSPPIERITSDTTPTAVARSNAEEPEANLSTGLAKIFQSSEKEGPRAAARPQMASMAVSMVSQSYSEVSSRERSSAASDSSPKSFWQGWSFVRI